MKILIGCEVSGIVRDAFIARGHDAWSCDLVKSERPGPHFECDVRWILGEDWDMGIFFPECTHLAVSGARYFAAKRADGRQQRAIDFFLHLTRCPFPWAIENPVGIMSSEYRKPDQIIQPWQFGHPESKKTCLWLSRLPRLAPTNTLPLPPCGYWQNQTPSGQNRLGPSPERAKNRARTYEGVARAMAQQWSTPVTSSRAGAGE